MEPLVSVIIAAYKVEPYLKKCVSSVMDQTYRNTEIILVDDGSPDNCGRICDEFAAVDERVSVIHKANGGSISARTAGLDAAKGEYAYLVDGDDWLESGVLESLVNAAVSSGADLVADSYLTDYGTGTEKGTIAIPEGVYEGDSLSFFRENAVSMGRFFGFGINPALWNKLFRTETIRDVYRSVPLNITLGEDFAVSMPYASKTGCVAIIDSDSYYHYIQRSDSMVRAYDSRLFDKISALITYIESVKDTDVFWHKINDYYAWLVFELLKNQFRFDGSFLEKKDEIEKIYSIPGIMEKVDGSGYRQGRRAVRWLFGAFLKKNMACLTGLLFLQKLTSR